MWYMPQRRRGGLTDTTAQLVAAREADWTTHRARYVSK
jgi:hypothetical protein